MPIDGDMRAAYVTGPGPARAIRCGRLPVPAPGTGEVLVAVEATTVNPVDALVRSGAFATPMPVPFILGRDLVGTVAAIGPGTTGFTAGDAVWTHSLGHGGRQGSLAEYAIVRADRLYPVPGGVGHDELVAAAHPAATAWLALHRHARILPGETLLVAGAAGNVGSAAVALAAAHATRVIATASAADAGYVRRLGADEVFDYRDRGLSARLAVAAPQGVDVHLDTSGRADLAAAVDLLAMRGRIIAVAGSPGRRVAGDADAAVRAALHP